MGQLIEAFNRREITATAGALDEFVVWDAREIPIPDLRAVYQGPAGAADFWQRWLPMWEHVATEIVWIEEAGSRVVTWVHQTMVGRESGLEVSVDDAWDVTFRDRKIIRVSFMSDEAQARAVTAAA